MATIRRTAALLSCLLGAFVLAVVTSPIAHAQVPPDGAGQRAPATPVPAPAQDVWPTWATIVIIVAGVAIVAVAALLLRTRFAPRFRRLRHA